eukprot:364794-Chlamydomonas_euryale.AAC.22
MHASADACEHGCMQARTHASTDACKHGCMQACHHACKMLTHASHLRNNDTVPRVQLALASISGKCSCGRSKRCSRKSCCSLVHRTDNIARAVGRVLNLFCLTQCGASMNTEAL